MVRLATYLASCLVVGLVLWWMASARPIQLLVLMWALAWIAGLIVTWRVARRDGRRPLIWIVAAILIGPLAWIVMSATPVTPAAGAPSGQDGP
jgi:hypothetical protein